MKLSLFWILVLALLTPGCGVITYSLCELSYSTSIFSDNPLGYWPLNDKSGTVASNAVGSGNGVYTNGPTLGVITTLVNDTAVSFDGTDDYVDITNESVFDFTGGESITLEAWIYPTGIAAANQEIIIAKGRDGSGQERNYEMTILGSASGGNLSFHYRDAASTTHQHRVTATNLFNNNWYHVVASWTFGSNSSAKLYINGSEAAATWSSGNGLEAPTNNSHPLRIGARNVSGVTALFNGTIDEVVIYRNILSSKRVLAHYQLGLGSQVCNAR